MKTLQVLSMQRNDIRYIPLAISKMKGLTELNLDDNPLHNVEGVGYLPKLKHLSLQVCKKNPKQKKKPNQTQKQKTKIKNKKKTKDKKKTTYHNSLYRN